MASSLCTKLVTASIVGVILGILGSVFIVEWPKIFDSILFNQLALANQSMSFKLWQDFPIPIYLSFYMFNWTNYDRVGKGGHLEKPNLVEMGPYVFREHRVKTNMTWNDNNQTITYYQNRTWVFEQELSNGSLSDMVTTVNVPAIVAAYSLRYSSPLIKIAMNELMIHLFHTKYHVTKSVRELIFDGYDDPIIKFAEHLPPAWLPSQLPFDKFGWFYTRNGSYTYDGVFNMQTGVEDIFQLGVLSRWNYANHTKFYTDHCGAISGSAGEIFPPLRQRTGIELYVTDICRTLTLNYKEDSEFEDIKGYRYLVDDDMFANSTTKPENWCYCGGDGETCYPNGVLNISTCKWGAPVFVSFPHFFHADPLYREAVDGMNPVPEHQSYVDLEPTSGLPMQVDAALQLNVFIPPMSDYEPLKKLPSVFFPTFWFRQSVRIDNNIISKVKQFLFYSNTGSILAFVFLGFGLSTLLVVLIVWVTRCRREDDSLYLVSGSSPIPTTI